MIYVEGMSIYFEPDTYSESERWPEPDRDRDWREWLERHHAQIMREQRRLIEARALAAEEEERPREEKA